MPSQTERLGHAYARFLARCLERRRRILLGLVPLVAASVWLYGRLETGFFPEFDEGAFVIDYFTPKGTSQDETDRIRHQVENLLGKTPQVAAWSRLTGARSGVRAGVVGTQPGRHSGAAQNGTDSKRRRRHGRHPRAVEALAGLPR